MKKIAFYTLGCRANQYQTEVIKSRVTSRESRLVDFNSEADIYVINTCTVTADADRKSRQMIRRALRQNPAAKVIVAGCYAKLQAQELLKAFPNIEIFSHSSLPIPHPSSLTPRIRANLMIQDGCEHFCSYCIVPYARGKIKSKPATQIVTEAHQLVEAGAREIILTGINLAAYRSSLNDVIRDLSAISNLSRLRLSSLEPMYLSKELIDAVIRNPKVCDHFHIPLQSGDDSILARMNRKYTQHDYLELVNYIRNKKPDCAITTDIIVGFPGEGQNEFQNTIDLINKIKFSRIHIFTYSKRKGTPAASFPDQVDPATKKERSKLLHKLRSKYMIEFANKYLDKEVEILVEQKGEGLTANYIRVLYPGKENEVGMLKQVRIKEIKEDLVLSD